LVVADRLFIEDENLITSSGGPTSIDVAAALLRRRIDESVITKASRILLVGEHRGGNAPQVHPSSILPETGPIVRQAVLLLRQYLSSPLDIDEIAKRVDTSPRKLERLTGRNKPGGILQGHSLAIFSMAPSAFNKKHL
jgi:transcriptional regulator GlxA family with amidase domain